MEDGSLARGKGGVRARGKRAGTLERIGGHESNLNVSVYEALHPPELGCIVKLLTS